MKREPEHMSFSQLDVLCERIAKSPSASSIEADQARDLRNDLRLLKHALQHSMTFKRPALNGKTVGQFQNEALKRRMANFLTATRDRWD